MITIRALEDPREAEPVLRILRHTLDDADFERRLARAVAQGYRVLAAMRGDEIIGALGYRFVDDLYWGRTLFVDDLIVDPERRSAGVGAALLNRAREIAADTCDHIRLCSGLVRKDAHRFYESHGLSSTSLQFAAPA